MKWGLELGVAGAYEKVAPNPPTTRGDLELPETRSRPGDALSPSPERVVWAQSPSASGTRGSVAHVNLNLPQTRGESLLRNSCVRYSIPVSQENLEFSFYFSKKI